LLVLAAADDDSNYASLSGTLDDGISGWEHWLFRSSVWVEVASWFRFQIVPKLLFFFRITSALLKGVSQSWIRCIPSSLRAVSRLTAQVKAGNDVINWVLHMGVITQLGSEVLGYSHLFFCGFTFLIIACSLVAVANDLQINGW
jgi:hypothetical protein